MASVSRSALLVTPLLHLACANCVTHSQPDASASTDARVTLDGGELSITRSCFSSSGRRALTQFASFEYDICLSVLFNSDTTGSPWLQLTPPTGFQVSDIRYGPCSSSMVLGDGGLGGLVPANVHGEFRWLAREAGGRPIALVVVDGGARLGEATFLLDPEPVSVDLSCPGD